MASTPEWIHPGETATLIWHSGVVEGPDGVRLYSVSGPVMERPPASPYFLLAPEERGEFAGRLYRGQATLTDLRQFLAYCVLGRGSMADEMQFVAVGEETPVLPLLDAWRSADRPVLPYMADINAFFPGEVPLYVAAEAYASAQQAAECFATAWVCEECGEAEDAGVFLWTTQRAETVRVCFLIQNDTGVWSCRLHPFEFALASSLSPSGGEGRVRGVVEQP